MKLLITGICGFVGSTIASRWKETYADAEIIGIDNFSRAGSWRNRDHLQKLGIRVLHGDIRNSSDLEIIGAVDCVLDAAANASVLAGIGGGSPSRQLVENNLLGTINLLELCRTHQATFILLSTSRVYSIPPLAALTVISQNGAYSPSPEHWPEGLSENGITETFSTASPVSLYGSTKLASEQLALEYGHAFQFPVWINRCGVMAGAGQFGRANQGIFAFWLHSWKEKRALKYIGFDGHGSQVRDCLHPHDLVELLRQQSETCNDGRSQIVNLSGGIASVKSLRQLSDFCRDRWGENYVSSDNAARPYDLPWVVLDSALAKSNWNWNPTTEVSHILSEIAEFADTQPDWIGLSA